jgi:integrase
MLQTHLQRRSNGYYYFRWVCSPLIRKILRKREIIKSLHTTSKIKALVKVGRYYSVMESLLEWEEELQKKFADGVISEQDALDEIYGRYYEETMPKLFSALALKDNVKIFKPDTLREASELRKLFTEGMEYYRLSLTNSAGEFYEGITIYQTIERMIRDFPNIPELQGDIIARELHNIGKAFEPSPKTFDRFVRDCAHSIHLQVDNRLKALDPVLIELPVLDILKPPAVRTDLPIRRTFQVLFEEFMSYKTPTITEKQAKNYRTYFPVLLHFIGDKAVEDIKRNDIKICLQSCLKFPKRNLAQYKNKAVVDLAAMNVPEKDRLAVRSVTDYKKLLQGIFAFAVEQGYIGVSPTNGLKNELPLKKKKSAFKRSEVILLLQNALSCKHEWKKWFLLLLAYTGARRGEIAQLRAEDFKTDSESGLEYILITDEDGKLKTENALRQVPLHPKLIELGLHSFISTKDGKLFTEKNAPEAISRYMTSQMKRLGIPKLDDFQLSRTLHSLRHSFVTETRGGEFNLDLIQAIVGHERSDAGQTDVYTSMFPIAKLYPVIKSLQYL